jgi:hypothetical protein
MRRRAVLASLTLLAAALLLRRRRRRAQGALAPPVPPPPLGPPAALEAAPRFVSVPWTLVDAPPERAELTLRYACAERMELDRVDAQETPTQVFVTVLARWRPPARAQPAWRREREATVPLSTPLGSRALVHAPTDLDAAGGEQPGARPLYP